MGRAPSADARRGSRLLDVGGGSTERAALAMLLVLVGSIHHVALALFAGLVLAPLGAAACEGALSAFVGAPHRVLAAALRAAALATLFTAFGAAVAWFDAPAATRAAARVADGGLGLAALASLAAAAAARCVLAGRARSAQALLALASPALTAPFLAAGALALARDARATQLLRLGVDGLVLTAIAALGALWWGVGARAPAHPRDD